jgi:hypothetical protein
VVTPTADTAAEFVSTIGSTLTSAAAATSFLPGVTVVSTPTTTVQTVQIVLPTPPFSPPPIDAAGGSSIMGIIAVAVAGVGALAIGLLILRRLARRKKTAEPSVHPEPNPESTEMMMVSRRAAPQQRRVAPQPVAPPPVEQQPMEPQPVEPQPDVRPTYVTELTLDQPVAGSSSAAAPIPPASPPHPPMSTSLASRSSSSARRSAARLARVVSDSRLLR